MMISAHAQSAQPAGGAWQLGQQGLACCAPAAGGTHRGHGLRPQLPRALGDLPEVDLGALAEPPAAVDLKVEDVVPSKQQDAEEKNG